MKGEKREEEKRKRKKRRGRRRNQAKVWNFDFCMETNLDHGIEWIYGTLRLCMINSLSPNLGF